MPRGRGSAGSPKDEQEHALSLDAAGPSPPRVQGTGHRVRHSTSFRAAGNLCPPMDTSIELVVNGQKHTVEADPDDPRADDIGGDLTPEWGLHAVDIHLAMGNLVDIARTQAEAYTNA